MRIYEIYAWGVPFLIMTVALILDQFPDGDFVRPNFGKTQCGFEGKLQSDTFDLTKFNRDIFVNLGKKEMLPYFIGPVGVLLFLNLLLFLSTARQLTCGLWARDDVKSSSER